MMSYLMNDPTPMMELAPAALAPEDDDGTGEYYEAPITTQEKRIATLELKVAQLATILQHITGKELPECSTISNTTSGLT